MSFEAFQDGVRWCRFRNSDVRVRVGDKGCVLELRVRIAVRDCGVLELGLGARLLIPIEVYTRTTLSELGL